LTRRSAFLIAICLSGDVILFNHAARYGLIVWWLISIFSIIIFGTLCPKAQKTHSKDNALNSKIDEYIENVCEKEEVISQSQVTKLSTDSSEILEGSIKLTPLDDKIDVLTSLTSIDELIEQGFNEKNDNNFVRAADLFYKALSLEPTPDLAFYLIMDCYWMWNNLGERDYALTQLQKYIKKYLPQFNLELSNRFYNWMAKANLHNIN